ncbi:MAG TPA: chromosomal replication initiator protein DnaA [Candidatus Paceibacterota bacterium]
MPTTTTSLMPPLIDNKKLWDSVLAEIELNVSHANFTTWFKDTHVVKQNEGVVYVGVPNTFVKDWLVNKYHKLILKTLRSFGDYVRNAEYLIASENKSRTATENSRSTNQVNFFNNRELPLQEYYINREDNLNPRYTFDSFVIGSFNELAHAAAQAIVKNPGTVYNPFFVYGSTGHGKTHLIQAIGNHVKSVLKDKKVIYITSERFTTELVNAIQTQKVNQFKEKYRKYDVFIMDDIQFLSNKEKTQEELFHLFNNLYENNKQIVFSSDKHPNFIPNLEERLKSRFAAGMIVDIPQPDHESRQAILKTKLSQQNYLVDSQIIEYIATVVEGNVRELEGVINSVLCQSQLKGRELNLNEIKNLLKNSSKPKKNVSIKDIAKVIADFYNIEEESIYEKTRRKEVVKPRQLVMYILREDFNISFPSIGQKLGGRDHTTVIHSCEKIRNEIKFNPSLLEEINQIRALI